MDEPIEHEHEEEHEFDNHEMDTNETAIAAYNKVDALIDLLIKKGIITEEEFDEAEEALFWDEEEGGEEEGPSGHEEEGGSDEGPQEPSSGSGFSPGFGQ